MKILKMILLSPVFLISAIFMLIGIIGIGFLITGHKMLSKIGAL